MGNGQILIGGTFVPNGPFAIVNDTDAYGGFRVVQDLTALNAIIDADRKPDMWVQVAGGDVYKLNPSPWNHTITDWTKVSFAAAIESNGTPVPAEPAINFLPRLTATDNPGNTSTDIDLATSGVTPGTYKSVTVDAYGLVTSGTNPPSDVASVSNSDGSLTVSPTTGNVVASLNPAHANTWTATQTFTNDIIVDGYTIKLANASTGDILTYNGTDVVNSPAHVLVGYNVKDYGALGTGSGNDAPAIQAAINAAGDGGVVLFPYGFYQISDTITTLVGQKLVSVSGIAAGTTLFWNGASDGYMLRVQEPEVTIEGITFNGNGQTATGILAKGHDSWTIYGSTLSRCHFQECVNGFRAETNDNNLEQNDSWAFYSCVWETCQDGVGIAATDSDFWGFYSCQFGSCTNAVHGIKAVGQSAFYQCIFGNSDAAIRISSGAPYVTWTLVGCQGESGTYLINATGAIRFNLIDCVINEILYFDNIQELVTTGCQFNIVPPGIGIQTVSQEISWTTRNDTFLDGYGTTISVANWISSFTTGVGVSLNSLMSGHREFRVFAGAGGIITMESTDIEIQQVTPGTIKLGTVQSEVQIEGNDVVLLARGASSPTIFLGLGDGTNIYMPPGLISLESFGNMNLEVHGGNINIGTQFPGSIFINSTGNTTTFAGIVDMNVDPGTLTSGGLNITGNVLSTWAQQWIYGDPSGGGAAIMLHDPTGALDQKSYMLWSEAGGFFVAGVKDDGSGFASAGLNGALIGCNSGTNTTEIYTATTKIDGTLIVDGYTISPAGASTSQVLAYNGSAYVPTDISGIGVGSVSNSDGTLTISPTTGAVVGSLNLGHSNTWTATQIFQEIDPSADDTYSLGNSSTRWASAYVAGDTGVVVSLDNTNTDWVSLQYDPLFSAPEILANTAAGYFGIGANQTGANQPGTGLQFIAGLGGPSSLSGAAGQGGNITIIGGKGGNGAVAGFVTGTGGFITIQGGQAAIDNGGPIGSGGTVTIKGGDGPSGPHNGNAGDVSIDAGTPKGTGSKGNVSIGTSHALDINVGNSSSTTSITGTFAVDGYTISPAGASTGQVLEYNGSAYVPTSITAGVSSVSNSDGTLTISPTSGAVVASLALGHTNTWTATQSFPAASIPNATLANSSISFTSSDSSLTVGASASLGGTENLVINLGHSNTWTADQNFQNVLPSASNTYSLGSSSAKWKDGYFAGKISLDGYTFDLSGNASNNQALVYNGTSFIAQNIVNSVSNSDSTITISPTTGAAVASLNLGHANTWTATQSFPAASIPNATLANSSVTVTAGSGLTGGGTVNLGSTITVNATVADVSNVKEQQLTSTSATDVISYTTSAAGNYRVWCYYRVVTANTNLTVVVTYTDVTGAQTQTLVSAATPTPVGSYCASPVFLNATNATAIKLTVTAGTANQVFVSGNVEALL